MRKRQVHSQFLDLMSRGEREEKYHIEQQAIQKEETPPESSSSEESEEQPKFTKELLENAQVRKEAVSMSKKRKRDVEVRHLI